MSEEQRDDHLYYHNPLFNEDLNIQALIDLSYNSYMSFNEGLHGSFDYNTLAKPFSSDQKPVDLVTGGGGGSETPVTPNSSSVFSSSTEAGDDEEEKQVKGIVPEDGGGESSKKV